MRWCEGALACDCCARWYCRCYYSAAEVCFLWEQGRMWSFYYGFSAIPGRNSVTVGIDVGLGIERVSSE
jgi:hypothetical protein